MTEIAQSGSIFSWVFLALAALFIYGVFWNKPFIYDVKRRFLRIKMVDRWYLYPLITPFILRIIMGARGLVFVVIFYKISYFIATFDFQY